MPAWHVPAMTPRSLVRSRAHAILALPLPCTARARDAAIAGTPEASTPESGTLAAGMPEAGMPEAGTPEAGMPAS
jgi:hypothetical protein